MSSKSWSEVLAWLGVAEAGMVTSGEVRSVSADSREVGPSDVFLAMPGIRSHGVAFASTAKAQGAWVISDSPGEGVDLEVPDLVALLGDFLQWFYDRPTASMALVGITGTNGKTSTSHYVAQWLTCLGRKVGVLGTVGNGVWGALSRSTHTTLDSVSLYRQLANWRDQGVDVVVMEVSSHAIEQNRIAGLSFAVLALTQVSRDHLDYHGSEDVYRSVKQRLFNDWMATARVFNLDDTLGQQLFSQCPEGSVTYSVSGEAMLSVRSVETVSEGLWIDLQTQSLNWKGMLPLIGLFNVENVLCALGCMQGLGIDLADVMPLLPQTQAVEGRMQTVRLQPRVLVDYAHTPDALDKALLALRKHCHDGRLWLVFGAGGNRDQGKRALMGAVAVALADVVVVTDDNPRFEDPAQIAQDVMSGMASSEAVRYVPDRRQAICQAVALAKPQDVVLIAGKGHEDYQEVSGVRLAFSDAKVVRECQT